MRKVVNWKIRRNLAELSSAFVLFLFLYTALSKLAGFERFSGVLATSPLLKKYAFILAWTIPISELALAVLLFIPATRLKGLYGSFALMLLFTVYLAWMIQFAAHLPCNCGGVISSMSWKQHIVFNTMVLGMILYGIIYYRRKTEQLFHAPP